MYNYEQAILEDIRNAMQEYSEEDSKEEIFDDMMARSDITGNGSSDYYASEEECARYVGDNVKLLFEALDYWGYSVFDVVHRRENCMQWCDTIIRCYLFDYVFEQVWEEMGGYDDE